MNNTATLETPNVTSDVFVTSGNETAVVTTSTISGKSRLATVLLSFFLGGLGIHRFYVGKVGTGILMLLLTAFGTLTTFIFIGFIPLAIVVIWDLIDFIMAISGNFKDKEGLRIKNW